MAAPVPAQTHGYIKEAQPTLPSKASTKAGRKRGSMGKNDQKQTPAPEISLVLGKKI